MITRSRWARVGVGLLAVLLTLPPAAAAAAERAEPLPDALENVGVDEHRGEMIPLELTFRDEAGETRPLAAWFGHERPVMLVLGYYRCPMLCPLVLHGLFDALGDLEWTAGEQFELLYVSIDPTDTPRAAERMKASYLRSYPRPGAEAGVHFLTGEREAIEALADAVGFRYAYVADRNEYAHGAVVMLLTPNGRISQYLYGVSFDPQTVRLALVEASEGNIGSALDHFLLTCFHYDSEAGRYIPSVMAFMRLGGIVTVGLIGVFLVVLWRRDRGRGGDRSGAAQ
ncbi:MAG: SCO family protein [Acidobacteriota bacterium]